MNVYCCVLGVNPLIVNSANKNKLLCKNLKCENTTGSKFNQLSLVAEVQLPFVCTNKRNTSPCSFSSPLTSLNAFTPRWRYSICYDGHSHLSRSSVRDKLTEQLWSEISEVVTDRAKEAEFPRLIPYKAAFPTSHTLLLQNEMDDMFGFKCIFNRTASSHLS